MNNAIISVLILIVALTLVSNLQEEPAGFGDTEAEALADLLQAERLQS
jgi:hypothetical protein